MIADLKSERLARDSHWSAQPNGQAGEDKLLVLSFQRGDRAAGESIYRRYQPLVGSICYRLLHNSQDAQEATQETFLRVYRALPTFNGSYQLRPWIIRIARNICLDNIRFASKRRGMWATWEGLEDATIPDEDADPQDEFLRNQEASSVYRVLASLPPKHRDVLLLRDVEGLAYCEIADALELSQCQVKNFLHRGRKKFRKSWTELRNADADDARSENESITLEEVV
jgi:RNA polymerase sigma-70 factor (ECF subfamily)